MSDKAKIFRRHYGSNHTRGRDGVKPLALAHIDVKKIT
jgi:hypothetical protein